MGDNTLRAKRSSIWMHFSPVVGKTNKAKCDSCGNEYSYSCGSTSNLALQFARNTTRFLGGGLDEKSTDNSFHWHEATVPSERVSSKAGQLISSRRSRLSPKAVQMLMFLNYNYKLMQ